MLTILLIKINTIQSIIYNLRRTKFELQTSKQNNIEYKKEFDNVIAKLNYIQFELA